MNLEKFFEPQSIAIIGASRQEGTLGRVFLDSLVRFKYRGQIFPVNPQTDEINGLKCYSSVEALTQIPDLAVILVRKEIANETVEKCGTKGIKNIIMITAGYREVGGDGIKREKQLQKIIKKKKIRLIGPNCMGIINTDPKVSMNASFSPTEPYPGNIAFISQSGALGVAVLEMSKALHLGFSIFVSEGNKADLVDADFLEYLAVHDRTEVISLYLESIEDVSKFRKLTSNISRKKPIIALKAGRSESGVKAASSHTGALASSDLATEAMFIQSGIIRAESIEQLIELSLAFSKQPIPKGKNIAVITNAGGPAILATDAIEQFDLTLAQLSVKTTDYLKTFLPAEASVQNPVDMIASADATTYQKTLKAVQNDPNVDAILLIIVRPPVNTTPRMIAEGFRDILQDKKYKPIFIILMAQHDDSCGLEVFRELNLPVYAYPESAARSVSTMLKFNSWRTRPAGKFEKFKLDKGSLFHIFEEAKAEKREQLNSQLVYKLLDAYGFPIPYWTIVQSAEEAVDIYQNLNCPLTLKIESDDIIHKSDVGGVRTNLKGVHDIRRAFSQLMENALEVTKGDKIAGILVQETVPSFQEVALGMKRDPVYGPMIMFGMGGIFVEAFNDVSFRIAPVSERDAWEMIKDIKGYHILKGLRGQEAVDFTLITETLQRLSQLTLDWPQIEEIDLNPFIVAPQRNYCKIVDARIRINLIK
jgi:acetyl coenzyme A synthetase (ADP forming)-like protein